MIFYRLVFLFFFLIMPLSLFGSESSHELDGNGLSLYWVIPFVGILLSIALGPLLFPKIWHNHFGKICIGWGLITAFFMLIYYGVEIMYFSVWHVYLAEYIPFITLLFALYTISGGIRVKGYLKGTPQVNLILLVIGTILASWMGTTGAAILLIRPLIRANELRTYNVHTIIFFIFLVANIGGALTPLGDPPLFLGFLLGVDFFWPTIHMFVPMIILAIILLIIYYIIDCILYNKESDKIKAPQLGQVKTPLGIEGSINFLFLLGVVSMVLISGTVNLGQLNILGIHTPAINVIRELMLLIIAWMSWQFTRKEIRTNNGFSWFPIKEVALVFSGIFVTIIPPIAMLKAAREGMGNLKFIQDITFSQSGEPINSMFFWITGILSAFLDNAPTYLVFFNAAGGNADILMNELSLTLLAISMGAVFFGAVSYIGNAPNFMVRSIAIEHKIDMPSFGGYLLWSVGILFPLFTILTWLFF